MQWFLLTTLCVAALCSATPMRRRDADSSEEAPGSQTLMQRFRDTLDYYDIMERPNAGGDPVNVNTMIYFENVDVDQAAKELDIDIFLIQKWEDPRLNFDNDDDEDSHLNFKLEDINRMIWTPDLLLPTIQVHGSTIAEFGRITVKENGEISSMVRVQGRFRCRDLSYGSNDEIDCPVHILSAAYRSDALQRHWREPSAMRFNVDVVGDPTNEFVLDTTEGVHETSEQEIPVPGGAPIKRLQLNLKIIRNPLVE